MTRLHTIVIRLRESFWFWPTLLGVVAVLAAEGLVAIDQALIRAGTSIPFLDALSASGGRSILTTVGTSMLTVAGTSFSITISVLATTSSTYGPRLVRNFMADRANQLVLAAFTSTFLYALVVVRSVHTEIDDTDAFVPVIAVHVAVLLGVLDVGVLVFFIHHIASSVQVTSLQRRVRLDLDAALDVAFPAEGTEHVVVEPVSPPTGWTAVLARDDGYVQSVEWERLRCVAVDHGVVVRVVAMPGTHVVPGEVLLQVTDGSAAGPSDALDAQLRSTLTSGTARTPYQDVEFALQQLVEIAVRGLASGSNDPYTAVSALDLVAASLLPVWRGRRAATALTDDDGRPVVFCTWSPVEALVDSVFAVVLHYAEDQTLVIAAARRLAERLESAAPPERSGRVDRWLHQLEGPASDVVGPEARKTR